MSGTGAVRLTGVSKRYTIYHRRVSGLKERLIGALHRHSTQAEVLWALDDVSLEVDSGQTLAVIGPNGCGKSTLLQVVAGILMPDRGEARVRGRVTSLLELGAGFSPDLSGRENVYLNASLHGVPRADIASRFDAIVAFAELERFIDMPVRNYSSGMYMRLGFSVAVHLDPEILLVDEAFAVGDESFQRKCLQTIREFQRQGITIVVVSHDLRLVDLIASRACLLSHGSLVAFGKPSDVIAQYHEMGAAKEAVEGHRRWGTGQVEIVDLELLGSDGRAAPVFRTRDAITFRLKYRVSEPVTEPVFGIAVYRDDGVHITGPNTQSSGFELPEISKDGALDYHVDRLPLLPGRYLVSASVYDRDLITSFDHRDRFKTFTIVEGGTTERFGLIELPAYWAAAKAPGG